jgi:hypothetical protein
VGRVTEPPLDRFGVAKEKEKKKLKKEVLALGGG